MNIHESEGYDFSREELLCIKFRAQIMAEEQGMSPTWARVYRDLAHIVDVLDAFIARSTECATPDGQ